MEGKYIHVLLSNNTGERLQSNDAPIGWDATKVNLVRDQLYMGILSTISVEFSFVGDFYYFLQRHRLRYGWDMDVIYRCYLRKGMTFQFEGKINSVPSGSENRKFRRWKCDITQSTAVMKFQNRDDTEVNALNNISLDQLAVTPALRQPALIRGKMIQFYSNFVGSLNTDPDIFTHVLPFNMVENGNALNVKVATGIQFDQGDAEVDPPQELTGKDFAVFVNEYPTTQSIKLKWSVNYTAAYKGDAPIPFNSGGDLLNPGRLICLYEFDEDDNVVDRHFINETIATFGNYTIGNEFTLNIPAGNYLSFLHTMFFTNSAFPGQRFHMTNGMMDSGPNNWRTEITYNSMRLQIWQDSTADDSTHPVILPLELFENLISQINGLPVYSPVFGRIDRGYEEDGEFAYLGVTTGLWLRGIEVAESDLEDDDSSNDTPRFNTSFKSAFTSYNWPTPLGVQITATQVIIDKLGNLLNREVNADLGEVDDLEIKPLTEFMFNEVLAGYTRLNEYEEQNGRDEPNTPANYTNSLQMYKKKLDLRSTYCGDSYGIEFARRAGIISTGSKDTKYDEIIFFVDLIKDEDGNLMSRRLEDILLCEGVFSPETMLNVRIANSQNLLRHKDFLNIPNDKKPIKRLFFQSKPKNANMRVVTLLGDTTEGQDIDLGNQAYFLPNADNFSVPIKVHHIVGIMANPLGLTKFTYEKENYFDLLLEVNVEQEKHISKWRSIATQSSPPDVDVDTSYGNIIKYGDGLEDFVKYDNADNDNIKYAD